MSGCNCIDEVNTALAERGHRIVTAFSLGGDDNASRVVLQTERTSGGRGKRITFTATCCPFCGVRYADAKKEVG